MTSTADDTALLLIDLQRDFLDRPNLAPDAGTLCRQVARLLGACRRHRILVAHVHTVTRPDGTDRMPHWVAQGLSACVAGTRGALPPDPIAPAGGELVVHKQFYSGFANPELDNWLRERDVRRVVVAGLYLHSCVRATALDAYQRGYEVWVVEDAVASIDALHGAVSRSWLDGRAAQFRWVDDLLLDLGDEAGRGVDDPAPCRPVATIGGAPLMATTHRRYRHRDPCRSDIVLAEVPLGGAVEVRTAAPVAAEAQRAWAGVPVADRAALLDRWAGLLETQAFQLAASIVEEVGKPRKAAEDEVRRAVGHVRSAAALLRAGVADTRRVAPGVLVRHRPIGVVGLVVPWNNPLALAVGKLAPAIAFGNAALLKPAPESSGVALELLQVIMEAGVPADLVGLVLGGREAAEALCDDPDVDAISVTGSVSTGRAVAARCAQSGKPVQGELGGNNATIVLADADLDRGVPDLLRAAFSFAGQRCTAIRRFIAVGPMADRLESVAREALSAILVGDPRDPQTDVGPMISVAARDRVLAEIERARSGGARLVTGGMVPPGLERGAWLAPTLLADVDPASRIAQEETFGPVAVITKVADLDEALGVANGVAQGLVLGLFTGDDRAVARVLEEASTGIVHVGAGPLSVHPDAPFGGWNASGIGPPEHGEWDAAFYTRPQAVYENTRC